MAKPNGTACYHNDERLEDLMSAYDRYISQARHISMPELFSTIVKMPARRFYVSEYRASIVIAQMLKGDSLENMRPVKRRMFREIFRRYQAMQSLKPERSLAQIVSEIVYQPAPEFYLSAQSAKAYHYKIKKQWQQRKMRKLQLWQSPL